ncbi:MAG: hypothetical protein R3E97_11885 [Candidatus Eisenbacteria bacterium]
MAGQLLWTRALVFFVHNSTYAFSAILAVYLTAMAAGSVWGATGARSRYSAQQRIHTLLILLGLLSVVGCLSLMAYPHLGDIAAKTLGDRIGDGLSGFTSKDVLGVESWTRALLSVIIQVAVVLALPALLFGAVFPIALGLMRDSAPDPASAIGRLYAFNTYGSVVGTLVGAFLLVPLLGTRGALIAVTLLPLLPVFLGSRFLPRFALVGIGAGALLLVVFLVTVAAPPGMYRQLFADRFGPVVWFSEGAAETVAICEHPNGSAWIHYSDGRGASGTTSYRGGWLYAHLPLLLHPDPKAATVICFGTGNTLGAASLHPLETLIGVELSSEVVKGAEVFRDTNHDVANNDRVQIIIDDGRNFLLRTDRTLDVVTEEPPLIHTAGVVNLYTKDFYQTCSDRMSDDGIMGVWLATWELVQPEVQMLVRAFVDVFPYTSAWDSMHPGEWILLGSKAPLDIDPARISARMQQPGVAQDLQHIGIDSVADLLSLFMAGDSYLRELSADVRPVTDDKTVVDFTIPRHARSNFGLGEGLTGGIRVAGLGARGLATEVRVEPFDRIYSQREPVTKLLEESTGTVSSDVIAAAELEQRNRAIRSSYVLSGLLAATAQDLMNQGQEQGAFGVLDEWLPYIEPPATADLVAMEGLLHLRAGRDQEGRELLQKAREIDPDNRIVQRLSSPNSQEPIRLGTSTPRN